MKALETENVYMDAELSNGESQKNQTDTTWYCLRSRRKQEHIAAAHVRLLGSVTVFCPRIRFRRGTRRGAVWVTEALFPSYFFARFALSEMLLRVRSAHGVSSLVQFGGRYPLISDEIINRLQAELGANGVGDLVYLLIPGERVKLIGGALAGLDAVITHVLPAKERVRLLLEFLGRETVAEMDTKDLLPDSLTLRFTTNLAIPRKTIGDAPGLI
jgi:transcriptional antiterminator RfaH